MANEINIGINTTSNLDGINQVDQSVKSLKTQLKEAQANVAALSDTFGATSKQAVEAAKSAAMLKDKIGDAKALTDAFNPDAKFKAVSASLTGVAGGFSAVTGAMGLFGAESKDVEKAILKVQSAMALASGIQAIGESADAFKNMKTVAVDAFKAIKGAIGGTGIGLLVIALGAIYAYWDDIKGAVSGVSEEHKKLNAESQKNVDLENEKLKKIGAQDNILKLQGKNEKEILKIKIKQTDEAIQATKINIKNQEISSKLAVEGAKRNYQMLKSYLDFISMPLKFLYENAAKGINKIIDLVNNIPGVEIKVHVDEQMVDKSAEWLAKLAFDPEQTKKDGEKVIKESQDALLRLQNDRAGYVLAQREYDKKASDEATQRRETSQKKKEDEQKVEDEKAKERAEKSKELLAQQLKEQEDLLADSDEAKENLRNERAIKEIKDTVFKKDQILALANEEAKHFKLLQEAKTKDKEIADQKEEAAKIKKRQDIEDDNELKLNSIRQEKNNNLDQQNEYLTHLETLYKAQKANGVVSVELEKEIAEQKKLIAKTELEYKEFSIYKGIEVAGQAGQLLQQIAGNSKEAAIGGIVLEKAASIASIIASTFATNAKFTGHPASILSFGGAAALPVALNTASGAIGIASIIAQASKSISEINATKNGGNETPKATTSKFATGGLVQGMGTSTSDSIIANLSNGESVINAKSTAMFGNLLSQINQAGGGVGFGTQSQANPIFKTYVVASEMTLQIEANLKLKQIARL